MKRQKTIRIELDMSELKAIIERARKSPLSDEEYEKLKAVLETLGYVTGELEKKRVSLKRLKKLLFGASTEKTKKVVGKKSVGAEGAGAKDTGGEGVARSTKGDLDGDRTEPKKKRKGHGKNGADAYRGAEKVAVAHESLEHRDPCPECSKGKVYRQKVPGVIVRVRGQAPIQAKVWELEKLRCNLCGKVFTASAPEEVGNEKYDESATSMVALLKYGNGFPFYRLGKLQESLEIPLPPSTQWELLARNVGQVEPVHGELIRQAAQGEVLHNDDTPMKVLELMALRGKEETEPAANKKSSERTGVFTTGIVSLVNGHKIALFFTGNEHAGENLGEVLAKRASGLSPPIHMSDALSRNVPKNLPEELQTIWCNCIAHGRRKVVDVADSFPDECLHILGELAKVYKNDAIAREQEMSAEDRLRFHQAHSKPVMDDLEGWLTAQFDEKKVEPNSSLGEAISYMLKRWDKLTRFLTVRGAPLDNNICERALKKAILHRKNALFYLTENGAHVGDVFMSLIHSAELARANSFDYLTELMRHPDEVSLDPAQWLPWNYRETQEGLHAI